MRVAVSFEGYTLPEDCDLVLVPGKNLNCGFSDYSAKFGPVTSLEEDLLVLASAVYASDIAAKREFRLNACRDFSLVVPVVNFHAMEHVRSEIEYILQFLSYDSWDLHFVRRQDAEASSLQPTLTAGGKTLLFSGGLDSFAAAVDYMERGEPLNLVSHYTSSSGVRVPQTQLHEYLESKFKKKIERTAIRVSAKANGEYAFPTDDKREESQRTRSFLFLVMAALAARRTGHRDIVLVGENGPMAIHLPLTAARQGPFSTLTAHPEVLSRVKDVLSTLLGFSLSIENPFLYLTKAEAIANVVKNHANGVEKTVSCWKASRIFGGANHCGECIPCLVRRIACEHNALFLTNDYKVDLFNQHIGDSDTDGKRCLVDLCEFALRFERASSHAEILEHCPELVNEHLDMDAAFSMYKRFSQEVLAVVASYPMISSIAS